jgi:dTDP-glucose 4,6-dehydratase
VGQTFNLGSGVHRSILEIANAVRQVMDADVPLEFIGDRPGQVFRHTCDAGKIESLMGWRPRVPFLDGLADTARWYRENEPWWRPQMWMRHIPITSTAGKRELH